MGMNGITNSWSSAYGGYNKPEIGKIKEKVENTDVKKSNTSSKTESTEELYTKGKTIGKPTLSKAASEVYEKLQKKYGNLSFILVAEDQKSNAERNISSYENTSNTVVLINEDKLEQMANDDAYAAQIEAKIDAAMNQLPSLQQALQSSGLGVSGYGIKINDDGSTSFFATMDKSMTEQRERIQEKQAEKKQEAKAEAKKAEKAEQKDRIEKRRSDAVKARERLEENFDEEDVQNVPRERITFYSDSVDDLISQINNYQYNYLSNNVLTQTELSLGQSIDFKG